MPRLDPHSYNDSLQPQTDRLDWKARVDFDANVLHCEATLHFRAPGKGPLDLDTRELEIQGVETATGSALKWTLHPADPVLGARLEILLPDNTPSVRIRYRTAKDASALQWLTREQTAGKQHPYLFSQCQAIHARSIVPVQDTPRIRITYTAELNIPRALIAVMAARHLGRTEAGELATERFEMPQRIPPYLLALAVGDLASRELGPRSRVWAEPAVVDSAAREFSGVDAMILAAEKLFGPYDWERFDLLTMPPSFPYGGMENPRLTFLTPTVIAGDKSLVNVVAHELAHSWTGNLITNASAEHFWLNEGFTVYAERRILELLEGRDLAELHAALGRRALEVAISHFEDRPQLTRLHTHLTGVDPDDAYSQVPYEKGYLFLRTLEEAVGRATFDPFIRKYVSTFAFQSLTTEQFLDFVEQELPGLLEKVNAKAWVDGEGIPPNAPVAKSARLEAVQRLGGRAPTPEDVTGWTPAEWQLYLETVPRPAARELCEKLEADWHLTESQNMEVLVSWLEVAVEAGMPVLPRVEEVLGAVGRMKYLKPLYSALARRPETKADARRIFEQFRDQYHPIARQVSDAMLKRHGA